MQKPNLTNVGLTYSHPQPSIWRIGMWWLALGGPLLVAVASIATLMLALQGGDPTQKGAQTSTPASTQAQRQQAAAPHSGAADMPAVQARNHAATATTTR